MTGENRKTKKEAPALLSEDPLSENLPPMEKEKVFFSKDGFSRGSLHSFQRVKAEKNYTSAEEGASEAPFSPDFYLKVLERISVGAMVIDSEYRIRMANAALAKAIGVPAEELENEKCFRAFAGRQRACPGCSGHRVLSEGNFASCKVQVSTPIGARTFHLKAAILQVNTSGPPMIVETAEDLTEITSAEERSRENLSHIRRSRDEMDIILNSVADGLIVTERDGTVLKINAAAERLLGIRQKNLFPSLSLEECIQDRKLLKHLKRALNGSLSEKLFELNLKNPTDDCAKVIRVEISPLGERDNRLPGTVFLFRDVTYERELDRMKSEFISTAAHELSTPLTSIMGFAELLLAEKEFSPEQQKEFINFIFQKSENLSRIISDLLDLSRIEAGRGLELHRKTCNINHLIREAAEPYGKSSIKHRLEIDVPGEPLELSVDGGKIVQVLENLLSNAFKYSPKGGPVRVEARFAKGAYLICVEDKGLGMTREQAQKAFDKFYRVDSSNTAVGGTGLGLSIAKYIVEAHCGRIWLESRKGRGTSVWFSLPLFSAGTPKSADTGLF